MTDFEMPSVLDSVLLWIPSHQRTVQTATEWSCTSTSLRCCESSVSTSSSSEWMDVCLFWTVLIVHWVNSDAWCYKLFCLHLFITCQNSSGCSALFIASSSSARLSFFLRALFRAHQISRWGPLTNGLTMQTYMWFICCLWMFVCVCTVWHWLLFCWSCCLCLKFLLCSQDSKGCWPGPAPHGARVTPRPWLIFLYFVQCQIYPLQVWKGPTKVH